MTTSEAVSTGVLVVVVRIRFRLPVSSSPEDERKKLRSSGRLSRLSVSEERLPRSPRIPAKMRKEYRHSDGSVPVTRRDAAPRSSNICRVLAQSREYTGMIKAKIVISVPVLIHRCGFGDFYERKSEPFGRIGVTDCSQRCRGGCWLGNRRQFDRQNSGRRGTVSGDDGYGTEPDGRRAKSVATQRDSV